MKIALAILFACVAVSNAAFSRSLIEKTQPVLAEAMFKVRMGASYNRAIDLKQQELQTQLVTALQQQATGLLNQIQNAVNAGQAIAQTVVDSVYETMQQLQALGANVLANAQGILQNLLDNVLGGFLGNKNRIEVSDLVNILQGLPGAVSNLVNNSSILSAIVNLISSLGTSSLLEFALSQLVGSQAAGLILDAVNGLLNRGIVSDMWNSATAGATDVLSYLQGVVANIMTVASGSFYQIQQMAQQFVSQAFTHTSQITAAAAEQFMNFLRPYQQDLGALYDQVAAQVQQMVSNFSFKP